MRVLGQRVLFLELSKNRTIMERRTRGCGANLPSLLPPSVHLCSLIILFSTEPGQEGGERKVDRVQWTPRARPFSRKSDSSGRVLG